MQILFDWKWSLDNMPDPGAQIIVYHPRYYKLYRGKFEGTKLDTDGFFSDSYCMGACEVLMKQTLTFGSRIALDLPVTGFHWDYISLNYTIPFKLQLYDKNDRSRY